MIDGNIFPVVGIMTTCTQGRIMIRWTGMTVRAVAHHLMKQRFFPYINTVTGTALICIPLGQVVTRGCMAGYTIGSAGMIKQQFPPVDSCVTYITIALILMRIRLVAIMAGSTGGELIMIDRDIQPIFYILVTFITGFTIIALVSIIRVAILTGLFFITTNPN
jgi:uncharacterized membrane protein